MKKKSRTKKVDELRPEYEFSQLQSRGVGKYHKRATAGSIVVLLKPDDKKRARAATKRRKAKRA